MKNNKLSVDKDGYMKVELMLNSRPVAWHIRPGDYLIDILRKKGCKGVKKGCETGDCGTCAVLLDGIPVLSCLMLAAQAHGRSIITIEGLGSPLKPHALQRAFAETGAVQCGFCTPGMIIAAKGLLDENPEPDEDEIRHVLDGNLCRCTGYVKPVEAVKLAAGRMTRK